MKTIWKYELETLDLFGLDMPIGAEVMTVQTQNGKPYLWCLVDARNNKETRTFITYGTDHQISGTEHKTYVGTYQLADGDLVYHLFELIE